MPIAKLRQFRDQAEALSTISRVAKNIQLEIDASEIRAERRLGELMQARRETVGLANGRDARRSATRLKMDPEPRATLAEAGIDKDLADRFRQHVPDQHRDPFFLEKTTSLRHPIVPSI